MKVFWHIKFLKHVQQHSFGYFTSLSRSFSSSLKQTAVHSTRAMSSTQKDLVAVCQLTAKNNKDDNWKICKELVEMAAQRKAKVVFLPEACDYIGEHMDETLSMAEPLDGPLIQNYQDLAKRNNIWISLGGIHEKVSEKKVRNAHVLISSNGSIAGVYRKAHLFDVHLPEKGIRLKESDYVEPGAEIVDPVLTPVGKIGLGICYDMRFPELGLVLRNRGAHVLTYPSAFTFATGASHWESLLRCRAVENQCYVIAAAQTGAHNKKRTSYGHAMVVDPWGAVIAQCTEGTGLAMAEIDLAYVDKIRKEIPVSEHRRPDLYPKFNDFVLFPKDDEVFQFGHVSIQGNTAILKTSLTLAFTNKKCVVPGHVLVSPIRVAERMTDLTSEEVADLFQVVQKMQRVMEKIHGTTSSTLAVQDGPDAGQTIKHVHVHILPRRPGDFYQNDEVYYKLQRHDKVDDASPWRTEEDMAAEAVNIRGHLTNMLQLNQVQ